ncbi:MAG: dihydroorotate dehydrogenase electron transfer subunit [Proteobacteria bacterium]|nr:dihydroorotate dehydrogenase electron transfer subunit [Pseudomonadota bacterium]MDA0993137.1 dihydroorotate dehydrogenase electron transfer subunit [Pseudomonadota bacterium]
MNVTNAAQRNRGTIFVEDASVIDVQSFPGKQFVIRLHAAKCAARATAGSFIHIQCDETIPMRRPLSIMRVDVTEGWIEVLFKTVGEGLRALGNKKIGDAVSVIGPIGHGFVPSSERPRTLLIGGGVGIPPMVFLAETLHEDNFDWHPLVIMGSEIPFPFDMTTSAIPTPWLADEISGSMPLLESWGIPSRLASLQGYDGCFRGYVTDLARKWLMSLSKSELAEVELFSCGPTPMLKAVASLAREFDLACQVSLEEFMACAVGGCAGCAVRVTSSDGVAMKRVCVDGPVFDAATVFAE